MDQEAWSFGLKSWRQRIRHIMYIQYEFRYKYTQILKNFYFRSDQVNKVLLHVAPSSPANADHTLTIQILFSTPTILNSAHNVGLAEYQYLIMTRARFTRGQLWLVGKRSANVRDRSWSERTEPNLSKISKQYQTDQELTAFTTDEILISCSRILGARIYVM